MSTSMAAPESNSGSSREKNPNVVPVPAGIHPVICYAVIDLGIQESEWKGQVNHNAKVKLMFEFPFVRQQFYLDDPELKPNALEVELNYSIYKDKNNKKTKLLKFIEAAFGPVPEDKYKTDLLSQFVNCMFTANVVHTVGKNGKTYANISDGGISPFNAMLVPQGHQMTRTNNLVIYSINEGFETENFANVSWWDRKKIKASTQAINHASRGGKFVRFNKDGVLEYDDVPQVAQNATPAQTYANAVNPAQQFAQGLQGQLVSQAVAPVQSVAPPLPPLPQPVQQSAPVLIYTATDFTKEQMVGWTDEQLVQAGRAHWQQPVVAAPLPPAPPVQAPLPPAPPAPPQAPVAPIAQPIPVGGNQAMATNIAPAIMTPQAVASNMAVAQPIASVVPAQVAQPVQAVAQPVPTVFEQGTMTANDFNAEDHDDLPF